MKRWVAVAVFGVWCSALMQCATTPTQPVVTTGGSETWGIGGKMVNPDGQALDRAVIALYPAPGSTPGVAVDTTQPIAFDTTDKEGRYSFFTDFSDSIVPGEYRLLGSAGQQLVVLIPSVTFDTTALDSTIISDDLDTVYVYTFVGIDTMRAPGFISGRVLKEQPPHSGVFCYIPGTSYLSISDDSGFFNIRSVAPGIYSVKYWNPSYEEARDTPVVVEPGGRALLETKQLQITSEGAPSAPKALSLSYDTSSGAVTLRWKPVVVNDLDGYWVYRDTGGAEPVKITSSIVTDTTYVDTVYDSVEDTARYSVTYQVRAIDKSNNAGPFSESARITTVPPSRVSTAVTWNLKNVSSGTASIHDTVVFIASYVNLRRNNILLEWTVDTTDSVVQRRQISEHRGIDTLRYAFQTPGTKEITLAITDTTGSVWTHRQYVWIVLDAPRIEGNLGDTAVEYGGSVRCSVSVTQQFGTMDAFLGLNSLDSLIPVGMTGGTIDTTVSTGSSIAWDYLYIRVVDDDGNVVDTGRAVDIRPREIDVASIDSTDSTITLRWEEAVEGDVQKYRVLSRVANDTAEQESDTAVEYEYTARCSCEVPERSCTIATFDRTHTKYWVVAVDSEQVQSPRGKPKTGWVRNRAPEFIPDSIDLTDSVYAGTAKRVQLYIDDINGDSLRLTQLSLHDNVSFDSTTLVWIPVADTFSVKEMVIQVDDYAGGYDTLTITFEIAKENAWGEAEAMPTARWVHTAVAVDSTIYAIGGCVSNYFGSLFQQSVTGAVETFDIGSGKWSAGPSIPSKRFAAAAAAVGTKIYVFGGASFTSAVQTIEIFDTETQQWDGSIDMPAQRQAMAVVAHDGRVYVIGGVTFDNEGNYELSTSIDAFDPSDSSWEHIDDMETARYHHQAVAAGGKIYILGGLSDSNTPLKTVEILTISSSQLSSGKSMRYGRCYFGSGVINGKIYVFGGLSSTAPIELLNSVEVFDPEKNNWSVKASMPRPRHSFAMATSDNKAYIMGGSFDANPSQGLTGEMEIYYP
jgi:hypothetical protein